MAAEAWAQAKHKHGVDDLTMISKISESEIVSTLKSRYNHDQIYTYIGSVLVSVNPFKGLPIYTDKFIETYCGKYPYELPPHVYALAEDAYRSMLSEENSQCVIISGESGAGKTEASKLIMQYIAAVSGNGDGVEEVKRVILESNPLLEAFGNAKTVRNNNSSRFGKFFQIFFNAAGDPEGGAITNYLLEKSRVVFQNKGERNFHIFYQLCAAANEPEFASLQLGPPSNFKYLSQSGCVTVDGVDDYEEMKATRHAMDVIGIPTDVQQSIFQLLAAILHMGNIEFDEDNSGHAQPRDPNSVAVVAYYLQVNDQQLLKSLTFKKITTGFGARKEVFDSPLNCVQASSTRDSLAKTIFTRIFDYIVQAVNVALATPPSTQMAICVLDIYGFEIFDNNGFEQFCINFVNEKLQQIFIELTLRAEQDEYKQENIKWEPVKFFNNKVVCDLIESKRPPGIFAVLDDVCKTAHAEGAGVDEKFVQKASASIDHRHLIGGTNNFTIKHYAGDVRYNCAGFVEKNKDSILEELTVCMKGSGIPLLQQLFPEEVNTDGQKKSKVTAGTVIKKQAEKLVSELMRCTPHYVRCIKPNETKKAQDWDQARCTHQAKYLGLLENVRVRRAGFAFRQPFDRFVKRFQAMLPLEVRPHALVPGADSRGYTQQLLSSVTDVDPSEWQLGRSKVFIRKPETVFKFEEMREEHIQLSATKVQKFVQTCMARSVVRAQRYQGALLVHGKKERRRASLYRPFNSDYARYSQDSAQQEFMKDYLEHPLLCKGGRRARTQSLYSGEEKVIFSEPVCHRLYTNTKDMIWESGPMYLSSDAVYAVGTVTRRGVESKFIRSRIAITDIQRVSLSTLSDNIVVIHVAAGAGSLTNPPCAKSEWMASNATQVCMQTGVKFKMTLRRSHCRQCGRIFCKEVVANMIMLKDMPRREKVCDGCYGLTLMEDTVLDIDHKVEFIYRLNQEYQGITGRQLSIEFTDSIQVTRRLNADSIVQVTFNVDNSLAESAKDLSPPATMSVRVASGLPSSSLPTEVSVAANSYGGSAEPRRRSGGNKRQNRLDIIQSHAVARVSMRMGGEAPVSVARCKALFDYQGEDSDYLTLKTGDVITITNKDDSGWWEGDLDGKTGYFPANFVEELPAEPVAAPPPAPAPTPSFSPAASTPATSNSLFPTPATSSAASSAPKWGGNNAAAGGLGGLKMPGLGGVTAPSTSSAASSAPKWGGGGGAAGMGGFKMPGMGGGPAPSSRTFKAADPEPAPEPEPEPEADNKEYRKALHDYDATDGDYISMRQGDIIEVVSTDDSGWWEGKLDGKEGYFPSNYTEAYTPASKPKPSRVGGGVAVPGMGGGGTGASASGGGKKTWGAAGSGAGNSGGAGAQKTWGKPSSGAKKYGGGQQAGGGGQVDELAAMLAKRRNWE